MKVRSGFVSNSSSSSFIIFGTILDYSDVIKIIDGYDVDTKEGIYVVTDNYLSEGEDVFKLTPEIISELYKTQFRDWDFINVGAIFNDSDAVITEDLVGLSMFSFDRDYHSSSNIREFKERYVHED